ncbi:CobW C-terminal domain-containing protein [Bordetella sputigena]
MTAAARPDARIGVTVLTGFLGSGKTTLLNRMLRDPRYAQAAVVINEFGSIGVDHHLVRHVSDTVRVVAGGCICCVVRGGLVDTLRDLFLLALRRAIPPFRQVLIETSGLASPAPILFTLRHEPFLAERYVYNGTIAVADAQRVAAQIAGEPEAAQQLALADEVAISKTDLATAAGLGAARQAVLQVNPTARIHVLDLDGALPDGLLAERLYRGGRPAVAVAGGAWLARHGGNSRRQGGAMSSQTAHDVAVTTLALPPAVPRGAFVSGLSALQGELGQSLLRMKGLVGFAGDAAPSAVHGVHDQLYPIVALPGWPEGREDARLVFIARGIGAADLETLVRRHLATGIFLL